MSEDELRNLKRELRKAADVLRAVSSHLRARDEANAALHLADTVRYVPLTVRVESALEQIGIAVGDE